METIDDDYKDVERDVAALIDEINRLRGEKRELEEKLVRETTTLKEQIDDLNEEKRKVEAEKEEELKGLEEKNNQLKKSVEEGKFELVKTQIESLIEENSKLRRENARLKQDGGSGSSTYKPRIPPSVLEVTEEKKKSLALKNIPSPTSPTRSDSQAAIEKFRHKEVLAPAFVEDATVRFRQESDATRFKFSPQGATGVSVGSSSSGGSTARKSGDSSRYVSYTSGTTPTSPTGSGKETARGSGSGSGTSRKRTGGSTARDGSSVSPKGDGAPGFESMNVLQFNTGETAMTVFLDFPITKDIWRCDIRFNHDETRPGTSADFGVCDSKVIGRLFDKWLYNNAETCVYYLDKSTARVCIGKTPKPLLQGFNVRSGAELAMEVDYVIKQIRFYQNNQPVPFTVKIFPSSLHVGITGRFQQRFESISLRRVSQPTIRLADKFPVYDWEKY